MIPEAALPVWMEQNQAILRSVLKIRKETLQGG